MRPIDRAGARFGGLVAVRRAGADRNGKVLWECRCDCGAMRTLRGNDLAAGRVSSCGCSGRGRLLDLAGVRFGGLIALRRSGADRSGKVLWECRCDCGNLTAQRGNDLKQGKASSCGCGRSGVGERSNAFKHGRSGTQLYWVWVAMKSRCRNPRNADYRDYGGRGIALDPRWEEFAAFRADMGEPGPGATLEREDNDGDYGPGNCRWASRREQAENRRSGRMLTIDGESRTVAAWSRIGGVAYRTILARLKRGWSPGDAALRPVARRVGRRDGAGRASSSPTYRAWVSMRSRCRNPKDGSYADYGGRGIAVDPRWDEYAVFLADMGERPAGLSLDRIDTDGDYGPENCRWADRATQIRNRRCTRTLTIGRLTRSLAEWSEVAGIALGTILGRRRRGWDPASAVFLPVRARARAGT